MKNLLSHKYSHWLLTVAFGLAVFVFWRYRYPFALVYQEQFQLFLFGDDYFLSRVAEPGGLARYVAEFIVQFYNSIMIGSVILAVVFMLLQQLTWRLMVSSHHSPLTTPLYPLSFVPAILLWYAMGDESVLLTYTVSLLLALSAIWAYPKHRYARWAFLIVGIPVLYWMTGPMVLLVAACMVPLPLAAVGLVYGLACILLTAHIVPFPLDQLLLGLSYYRFPMMLPYMLVVIPVLISLLRHVSAIMGTAPMIQFSKKMVSRRTVPVIAVAVALLACLLIPQGFDAKKYELIEYDYLVRLKDWQGIIAKAEKQSPDLPMSVSATNLALAMTNQLGERAFDFYQRTSEGLLPPFERNFATTQLTGEIYYHLGLVNTAQRFAFEAMEAIPNYNKSGRVVKRLAETNLINGEYDVARKYLQMLEKTIFYRPWAQRTMALLGHEDQINAHPLYGWLRKCRLTDDFLFSDQEIDKICGQLVMHNPQNLMAVQYLVMAPLLDGDAQRFINYVSYVQSQVNYNPRYVREAIAKIRRGR